MANNVVEVVEVVGGGIAVELVVVSTVVEAGATGVVMSTVGDWQAPTIKAASKMGLMAR
jgi:hypothetical protein